jgi:hypothetical protein
MKTAAALSKKGTGRSIRFKGSDLESDHRQPVRT